MTKMIKSDIEQKAKLIALAKALGQEPDAQLVAEVEGYAAFQEEIRENARLSIMNDLQKAIASTKQQLSETLAQQRPLEFPQPPSLDELESFLSESTAEDEHDLDKETPQEISEPSATSETIAEQSLADLVAQSISNAARRLDAPVAAEIDSVEVLSKRIQRLEAWLGRISNTGPGSGETRFLRLDDINAGSYAARDTHKILRYEPNANPAYDRVFFGNLSGDQGPIYSMQYDTSGYTSNANVVAGLTAWNNVDDCLDIYQADGSICQVGQENYIRVYNPTANTYDNGTFIEFIGVDLIDQTPTFRPFVNDANTRPLFGIGVLTTDVAANSHGRATTLGMVRNLDTTGASVGESWQAGDILWASPTYPGNYTKNKPTAPFVAQSVAAVTKANATSGSMLVRPTIWPRLQFLDSYSDNRQVAASSEIDTKIQLDHVLFSSGFQLSSNSIVALNSGLYKFDVRVQVSSTSSNQKSMIVWYKKNGQNHPYSAVRQSVATNGGYATITNTQLLSLVPGDNVSIHFSVTDTSLFIDSPAVFDGAPNIPAVQLTVIEAAL